MDKAEYKHQWYEKNKERIKTKLKTKYYSNHEAALEKRHQYYLKNKDKELTSKRLKNKEKYKTDPEWRKSQLKIHMDWYNNLPKSKKDKLLDDMKKNGARHRKNIKNQVMLLCGKDKIACVKCGINDIDLLTIDHINGRNGDAKKSNDKKKHYYGHSLWQKILRGELDKSEYQTLCMNCNWKRHLIRSRKVVPV